MRNLKKFLALVLAMMMTLSLMVTVNAATTNKKFDDKDDAEITFAEDIQVLTGMDIIQGLPGGNFGYKNGINRHQMATFLYRITTGDVEGTQVDYWATYNTFSDVNEDDDYAGYIGYCQYANLIKGYPDGTFKPMSKLTGYQALAMVLRAIGYKEDGHNFTGSNWLSEISNTTTTNKLLANVKQSIYNNRLYQPATRELVAEIVFQGILQPQVQWTSAFGYQPYGMVGGVVGSTLNPSLGQAIFGLTRNTGIIVGNAETGEGEHVTKIGFSLNTTPVNSLGNFEIAADGTITGGLVQQTGIVTSIDDSLGINSGDNASGYVYQNDVADVPHNVTRAFQWDSKLDKFGHKVDVWYNCNSDKTVSVGNGTKTATFTDDLKTYAVFDRYVASAVVTAPDADLDGTLNTDKTVDSLKEAAANAGFNVKVASLDAYWNYAFGPNFAANYGDDGNACNSLDFESPIQKNNTTTAHQLYLLISNSADKSVDMVVSLDLIVTQISQINNTTAPLTVGVNNGTTNQWFGITADQKNTGNTNYTNILQSSLTPGSDTTKGDNVLATLITGTNPGNPVGTYNTGIDGTATNNNGNYNNPDDGTEAGHAALEHPVSTYYHKIDKLTKTMTATVVEVNSATGAVTTREHGVINQSVYAGAVANNRNMKYSVADNVRFASPTNDVQVVTFTLDDQDNWIFWEPGTPGTEEFVYATYLDYATPTTSSKFTYTINTVNNKGEASKVREVVSYNTVGSATQIPFETGTSDNYDSNLLPKRDNTLYSGVIQLGQYVGYTISATGVLNAVTPEAGRHGGTATNPMIQGSAADFDITGRTYVGAAYTVDGVSYASVDGIAITGRDALVGAVEVAVPTGTPGDRLFLTDETTIYLVSGAGTDNQKVVPYEGISKLYEGHSLVIIHSGEDTDTYPGTAVPYPFTTGISYSDMIYYSKSPLTYDQNYEDSAMKCDVVYIPAQCVQFVDSTTTTNDTYFVGDNSSTLYDTVRGATQFTMYDLGGNAKRVWVSGLNSSVTAIGGTATGSAKQIEDNGNNVFYRLVQTSRTAWDDTPIYNLTTWNGAGVIGEYWNGTAVALSNMTTGTAGTDFAQYMATTKNAQAAFIDDATTMAAGNATLYNVAGAKVVNLDKVTYPGIIDGDRATLDGAGSIYNNTTVPVSCVLQANSTAIVEVIFVNAD